MQKKVQAAVSDHKQAREVNFRLGIVIDEYSNYRTKAERTICELQQRVNEL